MGIRRLDFLGLGCRFAFWVFGDHLSPPWALWGGAANRKERKRKLEALGEADKNMQDQACRWTVRIGADLVEIESFMTKFCFRSFLTFSEPSRPQKCSGSKLWI